jgi:hypothetical protein
MKSPAQGFPPGSHLHRHLTIETAAPDLPAAAEILRDYLGEMISRYYGRPTDDAEINHYLGAGHGNDDLVEPTGVLLLARRADAGARARPVGGVGLYAAHGYREIPRYGDDPLAEHWFEKTL